MSEKSTDYCFDFTDLRKILEDLFENKGKQEEKQEVTSKTDVIYVLKVLNERMKKLEEKLEDLTERMKIQEAAEDVDIEELNDLKRRVSALEGDHCHCSGEDCDCCDDDEEDFAEKKIPITISVILNK
jgi:hypothetical protein